MLSREPSHMMCLVLDRILHKFNAICSWISHNPLICLLSVLYILHMPFDSISEQTAQQRCSRMTIRRRVPFISFVFLGEFLYINFRVYLNAICTAANIKQNELHCMHAASPTYSSTNFMNAFVLYLYVEKMCGPNGFDSIRMRTRLWCKRSQKESN